ncbi:thioesterase II family protein [Actinomadura fibrosa]|uniref:Thioesterase II family protein n=1 Tax=Actinomadura fibrosa TaxID=111802 RepID=A0ABW2Y2S0_9ACTN|nr:alpha/beta fold hydrolase [Actinomadura fibrosa]
MTEPSPWGVRWCPAPAAEVRLFCLPHSGGGAAAYRDWAFRLAPRVEVVAVRLPGRETRLRERPYTRLDELAPALVGGIEPWLDRPHAWFGHSMGALIAFEVCRTLRRLCRGEPLRVIVSGYPAPHLRPRHGAVHDASAAQVVTRLRELGGTPPELLDHPAVLRPFLPTLRADFALIETYGFRPEPRLDVPLSVFGGTDDAFATAEELHAWADHVSGPCDVRILPGEHFYLNGERDRLLAAITDDLLAPRVRRGAGG